MLDKISTIVYPLAFVTLLVLGILFAGTILKLYEVRVVLTGSMSPTIPTGSAIFVGDSESYTVGDVVTFQRVGDTEVTTHRIISAEVEDDQMLYRMQGDANDVPDQRPVRESEISGKVWTHVPYLGFIINFFRSPLGFVLIVVIPALLIILEQGQKIRNEIRKKNEGSKPEII